MLNFPCNAHPSACRAVGTLTSQPPSIQTQLTCIYQLGIMKVNNHHDPFWLLAPRECPRGRQMKYFHPVLPGVPRRSRASAATEAVVGQEAGDEPRAFVGSPPASLGQCQQKLLSLKKCEECINGNSANSEQLFW